MSNSFGNIFLQTFPNIIKNNNNGKLYDIKIQTGCYDIDSINTVLQRQLTELTDEKKTEQHVILSANKNTLGCVLDIKDTKTVMDFNVDKSLRNVTMNGECT